MSRISISLKLPYLTALKKSASNFIYAKLFYSDFVKLEPYLLLNLPIDLFLACLGVFLFLFACIVVYF